MYAIIKSHHKSTSERTITMKTLTCLRCGEEMRFFAREKLQLGKTGWILGDLPNLIAGALETDIFYCPKCGKLEFYVTDDALSEDEDAIPQKTCPVCNTVHDFDYPKCPKCNHKYDD